MKQFPDAARLSSWAGICPGNNESAGKHKSRHTTHGNPWFRELLIECAWSASRKKESPFQARYNRLKPKIGHKRALVAVAHALTKAIYHVLATGQPYRQAAPELLNESAAAAHHSPSHQTPPSARLLADTRKADSAARMVRFQLPSDDRNGAQKARPQAKVNGCLAESRSYFQNNTAPRSVPALH